MTYRTRHAAVLAVILLAAFCLLIAGPSVNVFAGGSGPDDPPPSSPPPPTGGSTVDLLVSSTPILSTSIFSPIATPPGF